MGEDQQPSGQTPDHHQRNETMSRIVINPGLRTLAVGYGLAQEAIRKSHAVARILARILVTLNRRDIDDDEEEGDRFNADSVFVVEESRWVVSDDEWDREEVEHKVYRKSLREIVEQANDLLWKDGIGIDETVWAFGYEVYNLDTLAQCLFGENPWRHATIRTEEDFRRAKMEERRKKCEATASAFARACGHAVGTREFVKSAKERLAEVNEERDHWNGGENQMEHWANCYHAGSRDAFFSDNDFMRGRFAEAESGLEEVLEYMRDAFPLLMLHIDEEGATSDE
jgi:hypothetical protein